MKKDSLLILSLLMLILTITTSCGDNKKDKNDDAILKKYTQMAEEQNKLLPMPMMDNIQLDKVEALEGKVFKYYYTFTVDPIPTPEEFVKRAKPRIITMLQDSPDMNDMRKDGMKLIYCYRKSNKSEYAEVKISPDEY